MADEPDEPMTAEARALATTLTEALENLHRRLAALERGVPLTTPASSRAAFEELLQALRRGLDTGPGREG